MPIVFWQLKIGFWGFCTPMNLVSDVPNSLRSFSWPKSSSLTKIFSRKNLKMLITYDEYQLKQKNEVSVIQFKIWELVQIGHFETVTS